MRTIICKKCGATIDAALGECPVCGAMYYILPDDDAPAQPASAPAEASGRDAFAGFTRLNIDTAASDEIFNTSVWKPASDADATRAFTPQNPPPRAQNPLPQPVRQQPVRQTRRPADLDDEPVRRSAPPPRARGMSRRTKQLIVGALALLALLTAVIFIINYNSNNNSKKGTPLEMPDFVGRQMPQETAITTLTEMGMEVKTQAEFSSAPEGIVIKQSKKAGSILKKGETITLTVSLGIKDNGNSNDTEVSVQITVPNLVGKSYTQAEVELIGLGLFVTRGEDQFSDQKAGTVISQNPAKGSVLNKGENVLLIVSKGLEPTPSPAGFKIIVTAGAGGTVTPKGVVVVKEGESMTFTIAPAAGYSVREVKVDGVDVGPVESYTFEKVDKEHSLYIVFQVDMKTPEPSPSQSLPPADATPSPLLPVAP